jgi:hypothetical protein
MSDSPSKQNGTDRSAASVSAAASGTLGGFGATILTLVLTLFPNVSRTRGVFLLLEVLGAAIVLLIMSVDFYLVAVWKEEIYERFGTYGTVSYGIGASLLMVAVALMMVVLVPFPTVAYTILVMTLFGWILHWLLRRKHVRNSLPHPSLRMLARTAMIAIVLAGVVMVYLIEGGCF